MKAWFLLLIIEMSLCIDMNQMNQDHFSDFLQKMIPVPESNTIDINQLMGQKDLFHIESQTPKEPMEAQGVKIKSVKVFDDPEFAVKETTSKCEGGKCMIKECIGDKCVEF